MRKKILKIGSCVVAIVLTAGAWVVSDLVRIGAIKVKPSNPPTRTVGDINGLLLRLERGEAYDAARDFSAIEGACRFLDERWNYGFAEWYSNTYCFMEKLPVEFTHAWFPEAAFDQSSVAGIPHIKLLPGEVVKPPEKH